MIISKYYVSPTDRWTPLSGPYWPIHNANFDGQLSN